MLIIHLYRGSERYMVAIILKEGKGMKVVCDCEKCIHSNVCGIKEKFSTVENKLKLSDVLDLSEFIKVSVECTEFVETKVPKVMREVKIDG